MLPTTLVSGPCLVLHPRTAQHYPNCLAAQQVYVGGQRAASLPARHVLSNATAAQCPLHGFQGRLPCLAWLPYLCKDGSPYTHRQVGT